MPKPSDTKQVFKYGLLLGNKSKDGIIVRIIVEKESSDGSKSKEMSLEEVEEHLRIIGSYLWSRAKFETLARIK